MATVLLQSLCEHISRCDIRSVGELLPRLGVVRLSPSHAQKLLCVLLTPITQSAGNTPMIRFLVEYFDIQRSGDPLPMLTALMSSTDITHAQLTIIVACFPEKTAVDYYIDLLNLHDETKALQIIPVIQSLFPELPSDSWLLLVQMAKSDDETDETLLREFFEMQLSKTGRSSKCPSWVRALPEVTPPVIDIALPTVQEAVDVLLEKMARDLVATADGESVDLTQTSVVRDTLINQYCISTVTEKLAMLKDHLSIGDYDDSAHFQEFGPVNTMHTVKSQPHGFDHPCGKYGGCRMLLCNEFEHGHCDEDLLSIEEHQVETDWWRKFCDTCDAPVARHHAVRLPLFGGGWKGCYCSLKCMKSQVDVKDTMTGMMIGRIMEQLERWGIRDR